MTNLDFLNLIPQHYYWISLGIFLFLVTYAASKIFTTRRGLIPSASDKINSAGMFGLSELKGMYAFLFGIEEEVLDEFLMNYRHIKFLTKLVVIMSTSLVIFSFMASFNASKAFMIAVGVDHGIAWTLPVVTDVFILLCLIHITAHAYRNASSGWGRVALLCFTSLSVYFNIAHFIDINDGSIGSKIYLVGALAPLAIFVAAEFMVTDLRALNSRNSFIVADTDLKERLEKGRKELAETEMKIEAHKGIMAGIDDEVKGFDGRRKELKSDLEYMEGLLQKLDEAFFEQLGGQGASRLEKVASLSAAGLDVREIAEAMNVQQETIKTYLRQADRSGMLNGSA